MNPAGEEKELASEINTVELAYLECCIRDFDVLMEMYISEIKIGEPMDRPCSLELPAYEGVYDDFMKQHLEKFMEDVETTKTEVKELLRLSGNLLLSHGESKTLHKAEAVKDLRARMDADMVMALQKAELIKVRLEELDRSNVDNRNVEGCGPGSSVYRNRTFLVDALRNYLKVDMESFNALRNKISTDYRETMQRRYYSVTGENPDQRCVDHLISTGESETLLQKAIREQGRNRIVDTIDEIQERHGGFRNMEEKLKELQQVFMGMALEQAEAQGQPENNTKRRRSFWGRVCHGTSPKK